MILLSVLSLLLSLCLALASVSLLRLTNCFVSPMCMVAAALSLRCAALRCCLPACLPALVTSRDAPDVDDTSDVRSIVGTWNEQRTHTERTRATERTRDERRNSSRQHACGTSRRRTHSGIARAHRARSMALRACALVPRLP